MRRVLWVLLLALAAGCGGEDEPRVVTIQLEERSGSTQFGEAVLREVGDAKTRIEVSVGHGGGDGIQPVRIVRGSCEALPPDVVLALEDAEAGESVTEIDMALDDLLAAGYAISVHENPDVLRIQSACGKLDARSAS